MYLFDTTHSEEQRVERVWDSLTMVIGTRSLRRGTEDCVPVEGQDLEEFVWSVGVNRVMILMEVEELNLEERFST
jgi:hypothetical protein